ncbi:MAG: nucleotidyl transferase AbiEii/AbiGii toxin family protein, partial [Clostridia bacterium]|nr:nucleotidyl transferase AbiEii/AbiGii toxin family protein [Clostridia bacterium]
MVDIAASVLAKLKKKSREKGIQLQQLLNLFCQEEFIRRLSQSVYKDKLILKGGFLLYSISGFTTRPTVDADYLLKNYSNNLNSIEELVNKVIFTPSENEFIEF